MERKLIIYEEYTMLLQMERINEVYWNQNLKYLDDNNNVRGPHPSVVGFFNDRQGNLGTTLDLGCNYGRHFHYLTGEEINVHGVDIASDVIEKVQEESLKRYGNDFPTGERLKCASMLSLPFTDNFFDTVYMGELIEHLSNFKTVLGEINRVLKKDGILKISETIDPAAFLQYYGSVANFVNMVSSVSDLEFVSSVGEEQVSSGVDRASLSIIFKK